MEEWSPRTAEVSRRLRSRADAILGADELFDLMAPWARAVVAAAGRIAQ